MSAHSHSRQRRASKKHSGSEPCGLLDRFLADTQRWHPVGQPLPCLSSGGFRRPAFSPGHITAVLAKKAGSPVRLSHSRQEDFLAGKPRVPVYYDIRLGLDKEGRLLAKDVQVAGGSGARMVYAQIIVATARYRVDSLYNFQNVRAKCPTVYTNSAPTSCFRGLGNSQGTFVLESALDMAAHKLGIDPAELRLINDLGPDSTSIYDWRINSNALSECVDRETKAMDWRQKGPSSSPTGASAWPAATECRATAPLPGNSTAEPASCGLDGMGG